MASTSKSQLNSKRSTVSSLAKLMRTAGNSGIRTGHVLYKDQKLKLIKFDENDASLGTDIEKISNQSKEKKGTLHLAELYNDRTLCDLTLRVGSVTLCIHKLVLSRLSEKYMTIFNASTEPVTEIVLPETVNVEAVNEVIRFLYEETARLHDDNIVDILKISVQLGIDKLVDKCVEIMKMCPVEKLFYFLVLCKDLQLGGALQSMIELAAKHFEAAVKSKDFLQVAPEDLVEILRAASHSDDNSKYMAALQWLEGRAEASQFAVAILENIQLTNVDPRLIKLIDGNTSVSEVFEVKQMLLNAYKHHTFNALKIETPRTYLGIPSTSSTPTQLFKKPSLVMVGGREVNYVKDTGESKWAFCKVHLNDKTLHWDPILDFPEGKSFHCCVFVQDRIYVLGGCDSFMGNTPPPEPLNVVYSYHIVSSEWRKEAAMIESRMMFAAVHFSGLIYAIGGTGVNAKALASVECYNVEANEWSSLPPLPLPCTGPAACIHKGSIFVIGGYTHTTSRILMMSTVFTFNFQHHVWETRSPIPIKVFFAAAADANGELYVFGGATKQDNDSDPSSLTDICKYDGNTNEWSIIGALKYPRHNASAVVAGNMIYLCGGLNYNRIDPLATVERFNTLVQQSTIVPALNLPCPLLGSTFCLVE